MSSPSNSSSATAGRLRWTRPRRPQPRTLFEWGAAALAAAALYLTPALLLGVIAGLGWAIAAFVACLAVLVLYSRRFGSLLGVLVLLVTIGFVEFVARLGTAVAETCGSSGLASGLEQSGTIVLLLGIGALGAHRRRAFPFVVALIAAGVWVAVIAHVVPGGTGACFE
jgi:hypothetical protein